MFRKIVRKIMTSSTAIKVMAHLGYTYNGYLYVKKSTENNEDVSPPPSKIPDVLYNDYTMGRKITVLSHYVSAKSKNFANSKNKNTKVHISRNDYANAFKKLEKRKFVYCGIEGGAFYDAFDKYSLADKTVLIWGLNEINCDAFALWKNAKHVYIVDYNKPICEHEKVTVLSHDELKQANLTTDIAISYSSFEHDGLGRYGDSLEPNGDLFAMSEAHDFLNDEGLLFLGVPVGGDCLVWNSTRVYGKLRLPMLLKGWHCIDAYCAHKATTPDYPFDTPFGTHVQFLMVCKKIMTDYPDDIILKQDIESSSLSTHAPNICKNINAHVLAYKK